MEQKNNEMEIINDEEIKTAGQPLSDFLLQLEDYTPTVRYALLITYLK